MAKPAFVTGANAIIKLAGQRIAYCTDLSYAVEVSHAVPRVLGMYEGVSLEPLSYIVNGSLTVFRYVKGASELTVDKRSFPLNGNGNGIGAIKGNKIGGQVGGSGIFRGLTSGLKDIGNSPSRVYDQFDPAALEMGNTFDIEVFQKLSKELPVTRIREARFTRLEAALSKKGAMVERYNFTALYLDGDSYLARPSGYYGVSGDRFEKGEGGNK
jgi:hypothetical protein